MERQSVEKLVRENHGILVICLRNGIEAIVPLDLPRIVLGEGLQRLFLNRP